MKIEKYEIEALRTEKYDLERITKELSKVENIRFVHAILGLQTETAEFADVFKRHIFYGKEVDRVNLAEELGDILWYLNIARDVLGVSFEDLSSINIDKLKARFPQGFRESDAVRRDLIEERSVLEQATKKRIDDNFYYNQFEKEVEDCVNYATKIGLVVSLSGANRFRDCVTEYCKGL